MPRSVLINQVGIFRAGQVFDDALDERAIVDLQVGDCVYVAVENRTGANPVTVQFYNLIAEQSVSS